ncbi:MAG: 3-isopropylmalate dehydratase [Planctomycetota bacterium]|nr:MAG: 3-isopropylmalate dehydratase [Planctomycetota bacterium]
MVVEGPALAYAADDVNTDVIWPGSVTYVQVPFEEMPRYAMQGFDPDFACKAAARPVLVVGKNFGCGSSREQASECLLASGVRAVVARSFARIFYRNSINLGLPVVECPDAVAALSTGDALRIDLAAGRLECPAGSFSFAPYPPFVRELIRDGGLIQHIRRRAPSAEGPRGGRP